MRASFRNTAPPTQTITPISPRLFTKAATPLHSAQYFDAALRFAPGLHRHHAEAGNALIDWQAWPRAEATLRHVITRAPNDPVAWGLLGQTLFQENKNAEAKTALEKALALDPDLPEPHNYLAGMLVRAGDLDGAEREFRAALKILPTNAEWQANLAGLLASRGSCPKRVFSSSAP